MVGFKISSIWLTDGFFPTDTIHFTYAKLCIWVVIAGTKNDRNWVPFVVILVVLLDLRTKLL